MENVLAGKFASNVSLSYSGGGLIANLGFDSKLRYQKRQNQSSNLERSSFNQIIAAGPAGLIKTL